VTTTLAPEPVGYLARLADLSHRHHWRVLVTWGAVLVVGLLLVLRFGGNISTDSSTDGSESQHVYRLLREHFPAQGGDTVNIVVRAPEGVRTPSVQQQVKHLLAEAAATAHVTGVVSPYTPEGAAQISADGRTASATVQLDVAASEVPPEVVNHLATKASEARGPGLEVALAGTAVTAAQGGPPSEGFVLGAAAIILFLAFGSLLATGLPIVTALFGLGLAAAIVGLLMNTMSVSEFAAAVAAMVGLGVGIDYALLVITRHRGYLAAGLDVRGAIVSASATAGRSVVFAGSTVVVSLSGMFVMGESYTYGLTVVTVLSVAAVVVASVTLLPALLSIIGMRIDRLRLPGWGVRETAAHARGGSLARSWSENVQRHPWMAAVGGVGVLLLLAAPVLSLRLGWPDAGNDPAGSTTHHAYDLMSEGFGPGTNGPLVLAAELPHPSSAAVVKALARDDLSAVPGVASVGPPMFSPRGDVAVVQVIPTTGPQAEATADLVHRLRDQSLPSALQGTDVHVSVGGATAAAVDMTTALGQRLPWLIGASILLSVVVLTALLRAPIIAVKAALANVLSVGAAFGVVSYALSGSWLGTLIGIPNATPAPVYAPLLMFAILFGLSMDYEIFLMSRIREEYVRSKDNSAAITEGLATTARVITAAAAVMIVVFAAFIFSERTFLKAVGVGMASAILIDATVVRLVLVPAAMELLGDRNWWMPRWLDRRLPTVSSEGREPVLPPAPAKDHATLTVRHLKETFS
jgi:putative drug exporter of the RND superfamily